VLKRELRVILVSTDLMGDLEKVRKIFNLNWSTEY